MIKEADKNIVAILCEAVSGKHNMRECIRNNIRNAYGHQRIMPEQMHLLINSGIDLICISLLSHMITKL